MDDRVIREVDGRCAIVELASRNVVGVQTQFDAESRSNIFGVARKQIANGTAPLLGRLVGAATPERFVGVATDIRGGGRLAYIVGVEARPMDALPDGLPEDTVAFECPGGLFARIAAHGDQMAAYTYFVAGFRHAAAYVCDVARRPLHVYDADGTVQWVYEPVRERTAADGQGVPDNIRWEVVSLPPVRFAGLRGAEADGEKMLFDFFAIEDRVRSLPVAANYTHEYLGFACSSDRAYGYFGVQVDGFDGVPDEFERVVLPGGLFVHIAMHEMNGDDPGQCYAAREPVLARIGDRYAPDSTRTPLFRFHLGTSGSVYIPIEAR